MTRIILAGALLLGLSSCATPYNYGPYLDHMPRSILVLPPLNDSPEVDAPYVLLSAVSRPLGERGYYVFPVAVVDAFLKENGLPTPGEMHGISLDRIREHIGADAVLYLRIRGWGTSYQIINSKTRLDVEGHLVDVDTGITIWSGRQQVVHNSSSQQQGIIGMLVGAVIEQIVNTATDLAHALADDLSYGMVHDPHHGFLCGPYHPEYEEDQLAHRQEQEQALEGGETLPPP